MSINTHQPHHKIQHKLHNNANRIIELKFIYQEIATRMLERMDYIKINPQCILDIGSGLNIDHQLLQKRFPSSQIYSLDFTLQMLKQYTQNNSIANKAKLNEKLSFTQNLQKIFRSSPFSRNSSQQNNKPSNSTAICADALSLPIQSQSIDLVWSNLTIPYINTLENLEVYFKEVRRVLKIGGMFLITGLGVDSFQQLRDLKLNTHNFPDMHVIGDILVKCGFSNPVTDTEHLDIEYDTLQEMLYDIRLVGCGSAFATNQQKNIPESELTSKLNKTKYQQILANNPRYNNANSSNSNIIGLNQNNKLPLTLEIFYAHGFKDKIQLDLEDNQKIIQFNPHIRKK
jgi:malonyl-CoA O-methyltransferase